MNCLFKNDKWIFMKTIYNIMMVSWEKIKKNMQIVDNFSAWICIVRWDEMGEKIYGWKYMGESVTVISASGIYYDK